MEEDKELRHILEKKGLSAALDWLPRSLRELRVVYTDVDGTLLGPEGCLFFDAQKNLTMQPAQAIVSALKRGIDIVMVSGRHARQLRENARLLGFKNYIAEMGTQIIYNQGTEVFLNLGDYQLTEKNAFESIQKSGAIDFLFEKYPRRLENHDPWSRERECTPLFRGFVDTTEANRLLREAGYGNLELVDNGRILRTSETLDVTEMRAYHLVPGKVSKAQGMARDLSLRGIDSSSTVAIGDAAADLEFAQFVGAFFMLRNGLESNLLLAEKILETENVFVTEKEMGLGWAEVVELLLGVLPQPQIS
jgi:HAD superfamily hydrolase (TIGR01484 family)